VEVFRFSEVDIFFTVLRWKWPLRTYRRCSRAGSRNVGAVWANRRLDFRRIPIALVCEGKSVLGVPCLIYWTRNGDLSKRSSGGIGDLFKVARNPTAWMPGVLHGEQYHRSVDDYLQIVNCKTQVRQLSPRPYLLANQGIPWRELGNNTCREPRSSCSNRCFFRHRQSSSACEAVPSKALSRRPDDVVCMGSA